MVNVKAPRAMADGTSRCGTAAARNISAAMGYTANATTNSDTPP